jgi:hypothetical protein
MWRDLISAVSELEVRKQYQIEISKRFAALENLSYSENLCMAWKTLKSVSKPQLESRSVRNKAALIMVL